MKTEGVMDQQTKEKEGKCREETKKKKEAFSFI